MVTSADEHRGQPVDAIHGVSRLVRLDSHRGTELETVAGMFTIGDFATFTQVSIPALRLWDRRRILIPARADPSTGYRYYSAEQAALVQRMVALKEFGFTLAQIGSIIADPSHPEHEERVMWAGEWGRGKLDPESFDISEFEENLDLLRNAALD